MIFNRINFKFSPDPSDYRKWTVHVAYAFNWQHQNRRCRSTAVFASVRPVSYQSKQSSKDLICKT